jgi:hypothetical protein
MMPACETTSDGADTGEVGDTDPMNEWLVPPACSDLVTHSSGPRVSVAFAEGTPPDHACPAWWRGGPATIDLLTVDTLGLTFLPDGPRVTATFSNSPGLSGASFVAGDTVDAAAFHESCEGILINDALVIWRADGTPMLFADSRSFSNAGEWRAACDAVHRCPSDALDTAALGCRLPDDECSTGSRLLPVSVATGDGASLVVEPGGVRTLTADGATWQAAALGWKAEPLCTDGFGYGIHVVVVRNP